MVSSAALAVAGLTLSLGMGLPLHAQSAPVVSQPVVQALPNRNAERLGDALGRLSRDQQDLNALIDAGNAARELGDLEAAKGFFARADKVAPDNARVKSGMARTALLAEDPVSAIRYFREAEAAGAAAEDIAADQGLAYDLVGDGMRAQKAYALALSRGEDAQVRQRLAVSQAIGGDLADSEQTLMPLLRKQDKPAWRTRAFTLAIAGETREAIKLAETILPAQIAENAAPYLRYMPRLTKAQQAAAANLGRFPRASEIGRDAAAISVYEQRNLASADAGLTPAGEPLDKGAVATAVASTKLARDISKETTRRSRRKVSQKQERIAPPEPKPGIVVPPGEALVATGGGELPPVAQARTTAPASVASAQTAAASAPRPGFDLGGAQPSTQPSTQPAATAPATTQPPLRPSLFEAFADIGKPPADVSRAPGSVDISKIKPARPKPVVEPVKEEKPKPKPEPRKPAHPSRIWVQIGVGRDEDAIAYDWQRNLRTKPEVFKGREPHITEMNQTHRILIGPFATRKAANEYVGELGKAGVDGAFPWTSPAGQVVDQLKPS